MPEHHSSPEFFHATAPASHILDMAQGMVDLSPQVEEYKNVLVREVLEICHKYGLTHPKELETSPVASTIPLEDLGRLLACITKLEYIVEHRELPEEKEIDKEYTMDLPPSSLVTDSMDDHGFPVVVTRGETISVTHPFGTYKAEEETLRVKAIQLAVCGGKVVSVVKTAAGVSIQDLQGRKVGSLTETYREVPIRDHKIVCVKPFGKRTDFPVDPEGCIIGHSEGYHSVLGYPVLHIRETSYFLAYETGSSTSCHVYDEHGRQVDSSGEYRNNFMLEREEELILKTKKGGHEFLIHPDGSLLDGEPHEGFREILKPIVVDDSIYFIERIVEQGFFRTWFLKNHKGRCIAHGDQPEMANELMEIRKVGSDFFLRMRNSTMFRVTEEGKTEKMEGVKNFPILVGETLITVLSVNNHVYIPIQEGKAFVSFDAMFALEPIDDHRFYVIAKEGDQIKKRVFDINDKE